MRVLYPGPGPGVSQGPQQIDTVKFTSDACRSRLHGWPPRSSEERAPGPRGKGAPGVKGPGGQGGRSSEL
ncbi:unnamed protein product [Gadus morhua 'NCC']